MWWEPVYENHSTLDKYFGGFDFYLAETVAVRVRQWVQGCRSLDWARETWLSWLVIDGAAFRIAQTISAIYLLIASSLIMERPMVFSDHVYTLNSTMQFANVTLFVCFWIFTASVGLVSLGHFLIVWDGRVQEWTPPFFLAPTRTLRQDRVVRPLGPEDWVQRTFYAIFYGFHYVGVSILGHTCLAHMLHDKNGTCAVLLGINVLLMCASAFDDFFFVGGPYGMSERSRLGSALICLNSLFVAPLLVIWTVCSIFAAFPPSECVTC